MKNIQYVLFLLYTTILSAQPTIQWQTTLGGSEFDQTVSIKQTTDGGYITVTLTSSTDGDVLGNHGVFDFWVVKLNSLGAVKWKKALGGSDHDWPQSIAQTNDGGYIVTGHTESDDGDVTGYHGNKDAWVVKLNNNGDIEWQKALGGSSWDEAWSIEQTTDGGYIMAGRTKSTDGDATGNLGSDLDFWVVKLSSIGVIQWQKTLGGSSDDIAHSIKQTSDSGYIVIGETQSNDGDVQGYHGDVDYWVAKLDANGAIEWQKALGGIGLDSGRDIYESNDGYIACGIAGSNDGDLTGNHGSLDCWVVKLTKEGELVWQKALGGSNGDWLYSLVVLSDGDIVLAGATKSTNGDVSGNHGGQDMWLIKLKGTGELIWEKTIGGSSDETCLSMQKTTDNGFVLAGYTWSTDGDLQGNVPHGYSDFWVVKLAPETVGTQNLPPIQTPQLSIFPNPAQQSITLKIDADEPTLTVRLMDPLGRELRRESIANGGLLDIFSIPDGWYFVSAGTSTGGLYTAKFLKSNLP